MSTINMNTRNIRTQNTHLLRDCTLFRVVLSRITLVTSSNLRRFLFTLEVLFASCLMLALIDAIFLDQLSTLVLAFRILNFAAIDTAVGLLRLVLLKNQTNSLDVINV